MDKRVGTGEIELEAIQITSTEMTAQIMFESGSSPKHVSPKEMVRTHHKTHTKVPNSLIGIHFRHYFLKI